MSPHRVTRVRAISLAGATTRERADEMLDLVQITTRRSVMSQLTQPISVRQQLRAHWVLALSALLALAATIAVVLVLAIEGGSSETTTAGQQSQPAVRSDGGPNESAVAASVGSRPSPAPSESAIAAATGSRPIRARATSPPPRKPPAGRTKPTSPPPSRAVSRPRPEPASESARRTRPAGALAGMQNARPAPPSHPARPPRTRRPARPPAPGPAREAWRGSA